MYLYINTNSTNTVCMYLHINSNSNSVCPALSESFTYINSFNTQNNPIELVVFFFMAVPMANGSSQARDQTCMTGVTRVMRELLLLLLFGFFFLGPYPWHVEVPRLGVKLELQLPAYTTAAQDPSRVCLLHHSSRQRWIPDPLSETRDRTCIFTDTSQICFCYTTTGTP